MPSIERPIMVVHGVVNGYGTAGDVETRAAVVMRAGEELEDTMSRGCGYILHAFPGATLVTKVTIETLDRFEFEADEPLMDGQIPGGILREEGDTP